MESAADFDFAYDGSIPSPLATIFLTSRKWFTISLGARLNDTHQGPALSYTRRQAYPDTKVGTYLQRTLFANRREMPEQWEVSGFVGLLDDIESDLGGEPPHVEAPR